MTPEYRLEELFTRYWDGSLNSEELAEFENWLRIDPDARERFRICLLVAMTAGESIDSTPLPGTLTASMIRMTPLSESPAKPVRRRFLKFAGIGLAAGVSGIVAGWLAPRSETRSGLRLVSRSGIVLLSDNQRAVIGTMVFPGATIFTAGTDSSVTLALDDRSTITIPGDSSVSIENDGHHLRLSRGHLAADIRAAADNPTSWTIATDDAAFCISPGTTTRNGTALVIGRQGKLTDLSVEEGRVLVNHPISGEPIAEAKLGDYITVQSNGGKVTKESRRVIPDKFNLDLTEALPKRWETGYRDANGILHPEWWYDAYHKTELWEIRSHNEWTRGFARLHPDSLVRVKYRVAQPGPSQVCLVVRTLHANTKHRTGVLDSVSAFEDAKPNEWNWFERRADQMLDHRESPTFAAPWVAFLLIVNTYEQDLGLEIAAFEIIRPAPGGRL